MVNFFFKKYVLQKWISWANKTDGNDNFFIVELLKVVNFMLKMIWIISMKNLSLEVWRVVWMPFVWQRKLFIISNACWFIVMNSIFFEIFYKTKQLEKQLNVKKNENMLTTHIQAGVSFSQIIA